MFCGVIDPGDSTPMEPSSAMPTWLKLYTRFVMVRSRLIQLENCLDDIVDLCRTCPSSAFATETVLDEVERLQGCMSTSIVAANFVINSVTRQRPWEPPAEDSSDQAMGETVPCGHEGVEETFPATIAVEVPVPVEESQALPGHADEISFE